MISNLNYLIIHKIEKVVGTTGARAILSSEVCNTDEDAKNLTKELASRYATRSNKTAVFDSEKLEAPFPKFFLSYFNSQSEENFIQFTQEAVKALAQGVEGLASVKGGYLVFADYESRNPFIGVYLVRDTNGTIFNQNANGTAFSINKLTHVDFEKMVMACRINKHFVETEKDDYLTLITKSGDSIAEFFARWICAANVTRNLEHTKKFRYLLNFVEPPISEDGTPIDRDDFIESVYANIINNKRLINLHLLGEQFFGDKDYFTKAAEDENLSINTEFEGHKDELRKLLNLKAKADKIEISFPKTMWNSVVFRSEAEPDSLIIKSEALVNKVIKEMDPQ